MPIPFIFRVAICLNFYTAVKGLYRRRAYKWLKLYDLMGGIKHAVKKVAQGQAVHFSGAHVMRNFQYHPQSGENNLRHTNRKSGGMEGEYAICSIRLFLIAVVFLVIFGAILVI